MVKLNSDRKEPEEFGDELHHVGRIQKAHGLKGEVQIHLLTAHPDHLSIVESVFVKVDESPATLYTVERSFWNGNKFIFKLNGIDDRNTAEAFRGADVLVTGDSAYLPDADEYFISELIGMDVVDTEGGQLGRITDVLSYPAHDIYVVKNKEKEIMVPAVHEYIKEVNVETGTVTITLIDGLVD